MENSQNSLPQTNWFYDLIETYGWLFEIGLVIVGAFFLFVVAKWVLRLVLPRLQRTKMVWDEALIEAISSPLVYFVCTIAVIHSLKITLEHIHAIKFPFPLDQIETVIFVWLFIWFALRFIHNLERDYLRIRIEQGKQIDRTSVHAFSQAARVIAIVLAVLVSMQSLGFSVSAVVTFGGAGALAVALAARELLGNLFGGFMIYLDRPFSVGDWVRSPDKEIEGTVEHIGWRLTRIRTFDKRPLYVPNGIFSSISIQNPSRMTNRRIMTNIGVRYNDATKMRNILSDCESMLREHDEIDSNQTLFVNLVEFGESALNFQVYTFTKTTNWIKFMQVQQDVFLKIIDIIHSHGAQCAFPTRTLHIPDGISK